MVPPTAAEDLRPPVYTCRTPSPTGSGYHFEIDGVTVFPEHVSLASDPLPRAGDIVRLPPAAMILGPPGHYRYFTDPSNPNALELEIDGGPRHLVALRIAGPQAHLRRRGEPADGPVLTYGPADTIDRPLAELRQLRGLVLETWSDDIAVTISHLDGAEMLIAYNPARNVREMDSLPRLPPALPPNLRALELNISLGTFFMPPDPEPAASGPLVLDALPPLPDLRSLEVHIGGWGGGAPDRLDAATLARFPALERLALDSGLALHDPPQLRVLAKLRVLDLAHHDGLRDLGFVRELPELRHLDITASGVLSLEPLTGHPRLAVVIADSAPIATLPEVPPPELRHLSVLSTELSEDAVKALAAAAPRAEIRRRWNQSLADRTACATRIHVRSGGICHRHPEHERTLLDSDNPADIRELLPLLRINEDHRGSHCMCCGALTIELRRGDELLASLSLHHGRTLRHPGWPADGELTDPHALCTWLARRGITDACGDDHGD